MNPISSKPAAERRVKVSEYLAKEVQSADIALWRPTSTWGWIIAIWTYRKDIPWLYSHVTLILPGRDGWLSEGVEEKSGRGGGWPVEGEVARWPGKIHIYRVDGLTDAEREAIGKASFRLLKASYGWPFITVLGFNANLFGYLASRIGCWFYLGRRIRDWAEARAASALCHHTEEICSQHAHATFELGTGRRRFSKEESMGVTPNDIAAAVETRYVCTLERDDGKLSSRTTTRPRSLTLFLTVLLVLATAWLLAT